MLDSCRRLWRDPDFIAGARDISGTALGIGAWGLVTGVAMVKGGLGVGMSLLDRKSTRLNSSHSQQSRMPSSA